MMVESSEKETELNYVHQTMLHLSFTLWLQTSGLKLKICIETFSAELVVLLHLCMLH